MEEPLPESSKPKESKSMLSPVLQVALLIGVTLHLVGFLLFRVESNPLPNAKTDEPFVQFVAADSIEGESEFGEQAELRDSAPLFIPTRWNAAQSLRAFNATVAGDKFPEFEPDIRLAEELLPANFPITADLSVEAPADLLASRFWRFFERFGESGAEPPRLADFGRTAEIAAVGGATKVQAWTSELPLRLEVDIAADMAATRPTVYYVRISRATGKVGAPVLAQSSGSVDFDRAVLAWLNRPEVWAQLPDGYLQVRVFP